MHSIQLEGRTPQHVQASKEPENVKPGLEGAKLTDSKRSNIKPPPATASCAARRLPRRTECRTYGTALWLASIEDGIRTD